MNITEAESRIMEVIWRRGSCTSEQIQTELAESSDWREGTVKALINRLMKKGAISARAEGRRFIYTACGSREDWVQDESVSFLRRVFGGKIAPLVAHFRERGELSKSDIAALRKLVEDLDK
jgi:BlaI family transcriptional regulator, penicillinase repressor